MKARAFPRREIRRALKNGKDSDCFLGAELTTSPPKNDNGSWPKADMFDAANRSLVARFGRQDRQVNDDVRGLSRHR